jgi:hypothetical protein
MQQSALREAIERDIFYLSEAGADLGGQAIPLLVIGKQ